MDFKSISTGLGKKVKSGEFIKNRTPKKEIPLFNRSIEENRISRKCSVLVID